MICEEARSAGGRCGHRRSGSWLGRLQDELRAAIAPVFCQARGVDHVLGGDGHRCAAVPGACLVRPVLRTGPGAGGRGGDDAAGGAHADPGAAGGVRAGGILAGPIRHAQREGVWARLTDRVIAHPVVTLMLGVVFLGGLALAATTYASSGFGGTSTGPAGSASAAGTAAINNSLPGRGGQSDRVLLVYQVLGVEEPHAGAGRRERSSQKAGVRLGQRPAQPERHRGQHPAARKPVQQLGPPGKLPATQPPGTRSPPSSTPPTGPPRSSSAPTARRAVLHHANGRRPATTAALNAIPAVRARSPASARRRRRRQRSHGSRPPPTT